LSALTSELWHVIVSDRRAYERHEFREISRCRIKSG
jgi:hypothetical protein